MASLMVRTRLRTGIITLASTGYSAVLSGNSSYSSGANQAPIRFKCSVQARSISICTSRLFGFT